LFNELSNTEIRSLFELINSKFKVDFTEYSLPTMQRRVDRVMKLFSLRNMQELHDLVLSDGDIFPIIRNELTVTTTEMFRDIPFWKSIINNVLPEIKAKSHFDIWSNGCSSGEELYSLAIILLENNLLDKVTLIGSDINSEKLDIARKGVFDRKLVDLYAKYYKELGGKKSLFDYIQLINSNEYQFIDKLRNAVSFEYIDTVKELPNRTFDLILTRNVLIYFRMELQELVVSNLVNQLNPSGFFALGLQENISWCNSYHQFTKLFDSNLYQK
jgi:chemotaxis protein methyltransferase CheR